VYFETYLDAERLNIFLDVDEEGGKSEDRNPKGT